MHVGVLGWDPSENREFRVKVVAVDSGAFEPELPKLEAHSCILAWAWLVSHRAWQN